MRKQPEILQLVSAWQSNLPDRERWMTVLDSCWAQWMQLERDKDGLRKMTDNQICKMTMWQKNIERDMAMLYASVTKEESEK
jgi:hypothetical protein